MDVLSKFNKKINENINILHQNKYDNKKWKMDKNLMDIENLDVKFKL
jgi:hypothetical protein